MWAVQNAVSIVGWIQEIYADRDESFQFRLIEPSYHEHFRTADEESHRLLAVDVVVNSAALSELCFRHLSRGQRVHITGRLIAGTDGLTSIEAWRVERAETLESFRFSNHAWNYELKETQQ